MHKPALEATIYECHVRSGCPAPSRAPNLPRSPAAGSLRLALTGLFGHPTASRGNFLFGIP